MSDDVPQSQISYSSFEFLLQEIVPTSIRVSKALSSKSTDQPLISKPSSNSSSNITNNDPHFSQTRIDTELSSITNDFPGTVNILDTSLLQTDDVTIRIEQLGFNLGLKIAEILLYQNSSTKIIDILDIMKFICRDVWKCIYNKQIDNLRTNHRGTFVLIDNNYRLISQFSGNRGGANIEAVASGGTGTGTATDPDTLKKSKVYLWFPCGVIRGILMSFGVESNVVAEVTQFPAVSFNIHTSINN
ncbi:TRS33 [Candida theae]|uniref:TRS33 n=1 Tax=Candida theae TaxID=1198502 RepID=A0AAD5BDG8_9ASCO|nr:TRS33 [Candida theae]KAI5956050.1 TRS33 [Candida theae]